MKNVTITLSNDLVQVLDSLCENCNLSRYAFTKETLLEKNFIFFFFFFGGRTQNKRFSFLKQQEKSQKKYYKNQKQGKKKKKNIKFTN